MLVIEFVSREAEGDGQMSVDRLDGPVGAMEVSVFGVA